MINSFDNLEKMLKLAESTVKKKKRLDVVCARLKLIRFILVVFFFFFLFTYITRFQFGFKIKSIYLTLSFISLIVVGFVIFCYAIVYNFVRLRKVAKDIKINEIVLLDIMENILATKKALFKNDTTNPGLEIYYTARIDKLIHLEIKK